MDRKVKRSGVVNEWSRSGGIGQRWFGGCVGGSRLPVSVDGLLVSAHRLRLGLGVGVLSSSPSSSMLLSMFDVWFDEESKIEEMVGTLHTRMG